MIDIPADLSRDLKAEIRERYQGIIAQVVESGAKCDPEGVREVCDILRARDVKWRRKGAGLAKLLLEFLEGSGRFEGKEISAEDRNPVTAALIYLVDPFDSIPDYEAEKGYLDDVHVLNLAVEEIQDWDHYGLISRELRKV